MNLSFNASKAIRSHFTLQTELLYYSVWISLQTIYSGSQYSDITIAVKSLGIRSVPQFLQIAWQSFDLTQLSAVEASWCGWYPCWRHFACHCIQRGLSCQCAIAGVFLNSVFVLTTGLTDFTEGIPQVTCSLCRPELGSANFAAQADFQGEAN